MNRLVAPQRNLGRRFVYGLGFATALTVAAACGAEGSHDSVSPTDSSTTSTEAPVHVIDTNTPTTYQRIGDICIERSTTDVASKEMGPGDTCPPEGSGEYCLAQELDATHVVYRRSEPGEVCDKPPANTP